MTFAPPAAPTRWHLTWQGHELAEDELTGEHMAVLALINGEDDWRNLDPRDVSPVRGPVRLMSMIAAMAIVAGGSTDPAVIAATMQSVRAAKADDLLAALRIE